MTRKLVTPKRRTEVKKTKLEAAVSEAVEDVCQFHRYLDSLCSTYRGSCIDRHQTQEAKKETERLYGELERLAKKYPTNNSLKNKMDEARRYVWQPIEEINAPYRDNGR